MDQLLRPAGLLADVQGFDPATLQWAALGGGVSGGVFALTTLPPLAAVFLVLCHISYVNIYTPLKLRTPLCTLAGAIPGSLPVLASLMARGTVADVATPDVHLVGGTIVLSPSDLTAFLACEHRSALDRLVAASVEPGADQVPVHVEVGVVLPVRGPQVARGHDGPLAEDRVALDHPAPPDVDEPVPVDRAVEEHQAVDHHQVVGAVHVEPDRRHVVEVPVQRLPRRDLA